MSYRHLLSIILSLFLLLESNSLYTVIVEPQAKDLTFTTTQEKYFEISWEDNDTNRDTNFLIFASDRWEDLMPLESPEIFLTRSESSQKFLTATKKPFIQTEKYPYFRIIKEERDRLFDVCPLITAIEEETDLFSKGVKPTNIDDAAWEKIEPFLLPLQHTAHQALDEILVSGRVFTSVEEIERAGFEIVAHRRGKSLIVAKHPKLRGHLIKAYLDTTPNSEWTGWVRRIQGSQTIRKIVDKHGYNNFLKVPQKWIYQRKKIPKMREGLFPKNFILVVEDMKLLSKERTKELLKEAKEPILTALFKTINEGGLSDSHPANIPYSLDGRMAFIDTEYFNNWPVHCEWITKHLSLNMQKFWENLIIKSEKNNKKPSHKKNH